MSAGNTPLDPLRMCDRYNWVNHNLQIIINMLKIYTYKINLIKCSPYSFAHKRSRIIYMYIIVPLLL